MNPFFTHKKFSVAYDREINKFLVLVNNNRNNKTSTSFIDVGDSIADISDLYQALSGAIDKWDSNYSPYHKRPHVNSLNSELKDAIMNAFKETGAMDLYDGDAIQYLEVIKDRLAEKNKALKQLKNLVEKVKKELL
jgi:hypothetical protein